MMGKNVLKLSAVISAISGFIILAGVIVPILSYKTPGLLSPIPEVKNQAVEELDYTKASNWFVGGADPEDFVSPSVSFYTLSIPKLKIENATVAIGGEDLSKSLIQYPGTAVPGKNGNAVIFGHSILPISYKYRVENLFEVAPTDIQVLEQDTSDSYLTLVTCVPPGDPRKPKRLIVRARVVPPQNTNENTR